MPEGLDIDHERNMNGVLPTYAEHVLICTGKDDWASKIVDDDDAVLLRHLKSNLDPVHGRYHDPYHNVLMTNASFSPSSSSSQRANRDPPLYPGLATSPSTKASAIASVYLFPSFTYLPVIPTDTESVESFIKGYIKPSQIHKAYDASPQDRKILLQRQSDLQTQFQNARQVDEIVILICGHGGRDARCGILGPLLQKEFEHQLQRHGFPIFQDTASTMPQLPSDVTRPSARVGLTSHIGGHIWAGNMIIYIPPAFGKNQLAGKGVWYGRVEPKHIEGIVSRTIMEGIVIKELLRGIIGQGGEALRL